MQEDEKKEKVFLGVIGAFIGAFAGMAAIVLLGRIGLVASIAGVLMATFSLKGYELLGGKLSVKGAVICSVIMIVMTFAAEYISWAIDFMIGLNEADEYIGFAGACFYLPLFLSDTGMVWRFLLSLAILYIFTAIGAVPRIRAVIMENKHPVTPEYSTGIAQRAGLTVDTENENKDEDEG